MRIELEKPIVFFDIETTGLDTNTEKIVELSMAKLHPNGNVEKRTYRINPMKPIPAEATEIHGISDVDVAGQPGFNGYANEIKEFFAGCDIGGFNCLRYDIPFLMREFQECGIGFPEPDAKVVDVQKIYHKKNPRDLSSAVQYYCNREHEGAHGAEADILATVDVFIAQLDMHEDIGNTLAEIHDYCTDGNIVDFSGKLSKDTDGDIVYAFGKHIGKKVKDNLSYAMWMLGTDFPPDTKEHLRKILDKTR